MLTQLRFVLCLALIGLLGGGLWNVVPNFSSHASVKRFHSGRENPPTGSTDDLWTDVAPGEITQRTTAGKRLIIPQTARFLWVNQQELKALLQQAPLEFTEAAKAQVQVLTLPLPDGTFQRFRITNSPIMEPGLAAKFPDIRTIAGQGIDDPTATLRADWTMFGFHAQVFSEQGAWYIDPYQTNDTELYMAYRRNDVPRDAEPFRCQVETDPAAELHNKSRVVVGTMLRTYRLAVAATGEYTQFFGGTVPQAMAAIVTTVNRNNSIFERDLSVRFVLIANNNLLIYTNPATDPYTNGNASAMIDENQTNVTQVIGAANYDIGHLFGTAGAGLAATPSICDDDSKARGITAISNPSGDPFDVDYVAHEIGHQFGAQHSFNSNESGCNTRSANSAYEPGSGITIMGYASLCANSDLAQNSIPFFHTHSINQMANTVANTTCAAQTATGNTPPTVTGPGSFTIPQSTPFTLTASATDPNGDTLTYDWEQFDLGTVAPPHNDEGSRPLFRSYPASSSPSRTFPSLTFILNNGNVPPATLDNGSLTGEVLASTNRTMNFRCTVRDNRAGGGGVNTDTNSQVTVVAAAGPFQVTAPNTNVTWTGGSAQTVTWNVAGTNNAPISTANVRITLSTDGGNTFPTVLLASTANDGSESVTAPNISTAQARVRVEAVGNIYFDVSNVNFSIAAGNTPPTITTGAALSRQQGSAAGAAVQVATVNDTETPAGNLTVTQIAGGTATGITVTGIANTNGTINAQVSAGCTATAGTVRFQVQDGGGATATADLQVNITANTQPTLTYSNQNVAQAGSLTVNPATGPTDNGSIASITLLSAGTYTGTINVNTSTGVVTLTNAQPAGAHTIMVRATDNCGSNRDSSFTLTVTAPANTAPTITAAAAVSRQQGSPAGTPAAVGTVGDAQDAVGTLSVTTIAGGTATGITVTNITNTNGNITAQIAAGCTATAGTVRFQVTDSGGLNATADLQVNVTANTAPTLGTYNNTTVNIGAGTTISASASPTDNGDVVTLTATAPGFTGTLTGNPANGAVTVTNAGPAGAYTVTVTGTDNCGTTATRTFTLTVQAANTPPTITATGGGVVRQQGSTGTTAQVAVVNDGETPAANLTVTQIAGGTATGITVTGITNTNGNINATLAAGCTATTGTVRFQVQDAGGLMATADLTVTVQANTPPVGGTYPVATVMQGQSVTVTPGAAPTDNGSVTTLTATAPGFTGTFTGNPATGVVTVGNAGPAGTFTVTVTTTDNCGATTTATFQLSVTTPNTPPTITATTGLTRGQGNTGSVATIATVTDAQTPAGNLTVVATTVPAGISVTGMTNSNGTVSATIAAGCTAVVGANPVVLTVTDGGGLTATATLTVTVTANPAPTVGSYPATTVTAGTTNTIAPAAAPADNGTIASVTVVASPDYSGGLTINPATGVITAAPINAGSFTMTVTVTDNCGLTAVQTFTLTTIPYNKSPFISALNPNVGPVGSDVTITGFNLSRVTRVTFNGEPATFTIDSPNQITAKVPNRAFTGFVQVSSPSGTATSPTQFTVIRTK